MSVVDGWWIGASTVPSRGELWSLAQAAGGWEALEGASGDRLVELGLARDVAVRWTSTPDGRTLGHSIARTHPLYPASLASDERAPPVLYVEGEPGLLARSVRVALVGTRRCSEGGASFAGAVARDLASGGAVVVSGLALGIDAAAHRGAIAAASGSTIAVLGHGLGHQSPQSNGTLRREIVARGGAVVTGWPDQVPPERWTFVARNRWVAGLARAVAVVEAPLGSGALITARDAIELGVDVWVATARPDDPRSAGGIQLLEEQAVDDLEERDVLRLRLRQVVEAAEAGHGAPSVFGLAATAITCCARGRVRVLHSRAAFVDAVGLTRPSTGAGLEGWVDGSSVGQIAKRLGRDVREVQAELTRREVDGELVRLPSGGYGRR